MSFLRNSCLVLTTMTMLSACGGGDSESSGGGESAITASNIIKSPDKYSATELNNAANELVNSRYKGKATVAPMNIEVSQRFYQQLFGNVSGSIPNVPINDFATYVDSNGNLNETFTCYYQGSVHYKGTFDKDGVGTAVATFVDCDKGYNNIILNGTLAVAVESLTTNTETISLYFDNLISHNYYINQTTELTGYQLIALNYNEIDGAFSSTSEQKILFSLGDNSQTMLDTTVLYGSSNTGYSFNIEGKAYLGDTGYVDISSSSMKGYPGYSRGGQLVFTGDKKVAFEFIEHNVKYIEDSDNDGSFDVGTYFANVYEIESSTIANKKLVALTELSLPPNNLGRPRTVQYSDVYTIDAIVVEPGYFSDPDTPEADLEISYRWYINGELVENQSSDTLPAYSAVFGDEVTVTMVVFDGANAIESGATYISIKDSPIQVAFSGVPDSVSAGDSIKFSVEVSDPDVAGDSEQGVLVSGPSGVSIDSDGVVTWQVSQDFLFPYQTFEFTFGVAGENDEIIDQKTVSIKAKSDKAFPIARSGIEVPTQNKSIWVGDFDGDGQNEVLSTDSNNSVFLLEHKDGIYSQKWVYPFKLPTQGSISQVLAYNLDDDISKEILVITQHGVSVIDGLDSPATILFTTDDFIANAAIDDINNDGKPVLAYLHANNTYSENNTVSVIEMKTPENVLFSTAVTNARKVIFANVDNDLALELILNNGLVYDGVSWLNEWISGTEFGDSSVTAGDYNDDGIAEIAGADTWGNVTVYSVLTKSQIDSFDNFNTCSLHSANVDEDSADELLVGDCQWGTISAYDLVSDKLVLQWQVDMQGHGSASVVAGDSDNDGQLEVHWGTGQSSSGQDSFVVADLTIETVDNIDVNSAFVKEAALTTQLDSFSSAGWASIDGANDRAVFFIPGTESGYGGSRLVAMDKQGGYQLSDEISSNWDNSKYAVTTDFNNDGFGDIFLPSTDLYNGGFAAMQLFDSAVHWQREGDYNSTIGLIKSQDLNDDSFEDAIYIDNKTLNAIDIDNQQIIFNHSFDGFISDFSINKISSKLVAVAHNNSVSLFSLNNSKLSELSFIEQSCERISFFNADTDAELELLCSSSQIASANYSRGLIIYNIVENALIETSVHLLEQTVIDIVIDTSTVNQQSLFVTTSSEENYNYWDDDSNYQIKKMSAQGQNIWSSPELIGRPTEHGLKVRYTKENGHQMMLSTQSMMYLIN